MIDPNANQPEPLPLPLPEIIPQPLPGAPHKQRVDSSHKTYTRLVRRLVVIGIIFVCAIAFAIVAGRFVGQDISKCEITKEDVKIDPTTIQTVKQGESKASPTRIDVADQKPNNNAAFVTTSGEATASRLFVDHQLDFIREFITGNAPSEAKSRKELGVAIEALLPSRGTPLKWKVSVSSIDTSEGITIVPFLVQVENKHFTKVMWLFVSGTPSASIFKYKGQRDVATFKSSESLMLIGKVREASYRIEERTFVPILYIGAATFAVDGHLEDLP